MNLVETIIKRFNLNVLSIDNVPESFSSQVYKLNLTNGETVYENNNMVVGIIDFESARAGSSEIDFTKINRYVWEVNPQSRIPYKEGYTTIRPQMDLETILPFL